MAFGQSTTTWLDDKPTVLSVMCVAFVVGCAALIFIVTAVYVAFCSKRSTRIRNASGMSIVVEPESTSSTPLPTSASLVRSSTTKKSQAAPVDPSRLGITKQPCVTAADFPPLPPMP
ncbi:Uncharacterized protein PBTT_08919 [Plasmodiophora brassicae]